MVSIRKREIDFDFEDDEGEDPFVIKYDEQNEELLVVHKPTGDTFPLSTEKASPEDVSSLQDDLSVLEDDYNSHDHEGETINPDEVVSNKGDFGEVSTERLGSNGRFVFASEFESLQDAIDDADEGSVVYIDNSYNESIEIDKPLTITSSSPYSDDVGVVASDDSTPLVTIIESNVHFRDVRMNQNSGSTNTIEFVGVSNCSVIGCDINVSGGEDTILIDENSGRIRVVGCEFQDENAQIDGDNNVFVANTNVSTITDDGSGNEVDLNT